MVAWRAPGDILRWWRSTIVGWTQRELAEHLAIAATTVSNWESGSRGISLDLEVIDQALGARGVLAALLSACGTPRGLPASRVWTKVYPGPSTPVWMWVRSNRPSIRVEGEWGVVSFETEVQLGVNGLFVTVGGSVADSPVVVQLSAPGWADFGRGDLPTAIPNTQIIAAIDHVRPSSARGAFMDLFTADLKDRLRSYQPRPRTADSTAVDSRLSAFAEQFSTASPHRPQGPWPPLPPEAGAIDRQRFVRLRKARGLSISQAADQLTAVTGVACSKDTLRRFESYQGEPIYRLLPAALDRVLGAEGHLALTMIRSGQGPGAVSFPPYWHAPVWIALDSPHPELSVELRWATWARRLSGISPLLLVSHYADPTAPLRIDADAATRWSVGLGRPAGAIPINHGWTPISVEAARQALEATQAALLDAIDRNQIGSSEGRVDEGPP